MVELGRLIRDIPDFPKKGILFKDITTLLKEPAPFKQAIDQLSKLGKLPGQVISTEYDLEYGTNTLELHADAITAGQRVLIVDDLLATGGTVSATIELVERLEGQVVAVAFLVELSALNGRDRLGDYEVVSLITF
jgi:adenine phosphoribosyltransferase